jgi:rubrerythrin
MVEDRKWRCNRCTHEWSPRSEDMPKVCPRCKSPYWSSERKMAPRLDKGEKV